MDKIGLIHQPMKFVALAACAALVLTFAQSTDLRAPSTRRMAEMLDRIYSQTDWKSDPNKAPERAAYDRNGLQKADLPLRTKLLATIDLADNLLVAGDSAAAVKELEGLRAFISEKGIVPAPAFDKHLRASLAMAYLRMGEQENCRLNHNSQSCIYPLREKAFHAATQGAEGAVREYTAILEKDPSNLTARWLLNIAYMALGKHPSGVPEKYLIPDTTILPIENDVEQFIDVAGGAGVAAGTHAGGSVAEDMDGDGYFDLVVSSSGPRDQLRYFHNNGDGTFADQTMAAGLEGETGGLNVIHADYNNDGRPDLLVLRGGWWAENGRYPASLLRNNGKDARGQVTFTDVTEEAGLLSLHPTQTAAWADFDNDGLPDLFIGHESKASDPNPSQLFRNNGRNAKGEFTFTDIAPQLGLADLGFVKGAAWGDYNNDGRPDLYVSVSGGSNKLFRNDGPGEKPGQWKFTDVTKQAGVAEQKHSFVTWWFDYDNDGWLDLLVTGYYADTTDDLPAFFLGLPNKAELARLYHNNGDGTFRDVSKEVGLDRVILAMGSGFGDLDNDGWLDCYFGTGAPEYEMLLPNRMFRNDRGQRFQDVTRTGGFGNLQKGHAVSFADFNRDGNQDVYEVLGGAYPGDLYYSVLLQNPGHSNHWIGLKLEGIKSNRAAIGARVRIDTTVRGVKQSFYRMVQSGSSFGDTPFELHVGIGGAEQVERVEILWPSGIRDQLAALKADHSYRIVEKSQTAVAMDIRPFRFSGEHAHTH